MDGPGLAAGDLVFAQDVLVYLLFRFAPGIPPETTVRSVDVLGLEGDAASHACESGCDGRDRDDSSLRREKGSLEIGCAPREQPG
jgi:hypothetical protein